MIDEPTWWQHSSFATSVCLQLFAEILVDKLNFSIKSLCFIFIAMVMVLMIYYLVSVADTFILRNTCEWLNCEYILEGYFIEGFLYEPARFNLKI